MRLPTIVGIVIAVVLLAAGLLAPLLRDSAKRKAERAQQQAALAQRELARYSLMLPRAAERVNAEKLKEVGLPGAAETARPRLQQVSEEYTKLVRRAQQLASAQDLPSPTVVPLTGDAAGAQRALSEFQAQTKANADLLNKALTDARAAAQTDAGALGVQQTVGLAEYARAAGLLLEAGKLRAEQLAAQERLVTLNAQWRAASGYLDHYRGLDMAPIRGQLEADLRELARLDAEAAAARKSLEEQVAAREREVADVTAQLESASRELRELESRGFAAGDDAAFAAYRAAYTALLARIGELQLAEQELRFGGRRGARLTEDDPLTAPLEGGQEVVGLEELKRRLETAQQRARRTASGHEALEAHVRFVGESAERAEREAGRFQDRVRQLATERRAAAEEAVGLAERAFAKESEALQAGENAVRAFTQARSAADAWMRAQKELQSTADAKGKNDRLRLVTRDALFEQVPRAAEAAARVLVGRIHALRLDGALALSRDLLAYVEDDPEFAFDRTKYDDEIVAAQTAGRDTLEAARNLYSGMVERFKTSGWVPQTALAAVHHLLARVDRGQAEAHRLAAQEVVSKALTDKLREFPYARGLVRFADHLQAPPPPVEPEPAGRAGDTPARTP